MKSPSLWLRSLAALIDCTIVWSLFYFAVRIWGISKTQGEWYISGTPALLLLLGIAGYWLLPEWLAGATLGKLSCDLRVVTLKGKKISLSQSVKRNALRIIDFFGFYLVGFICAKLTPNQQRLGDLWAQTRVVSCSKIKRQAQLPVQSINPPQPASTSPPPFS